MKIGNSLVFLIVLSPTLAALGQEVAKPDTGSLDSGTIESQFDYINSVSNNYEEFKVVRRSNLNKIKANVLDSLKVFTDQIATLNNELKEQKASKDQLNSSLSTTQAELQAALDMKDSFSFMGISLHKSTYNPILWGIVIILGVFLLFFIYRFKRNYSVTAELKQTL